MLWTLREYKGYKFYEPYTLAGLPDPCRRRPDDRQFTKYLAWNKCAGLHRRDVPRGRIAEPEINLVSLLISLVNLEYICKNDKIFIAFLP